MVPDGRFPRQPFGLCIMRPIAREFHAIRWCFGPVKKGASEAPSSISRRVVRRCIQHRIFGAHVLSGRVLRARLRPCCRAAGWGLCRRSCESVVSTRANVKPCSMAACGVWSGCWGQVVPDVKANQDGCGLDESRAHASRLLASERGVHAFAVRAAYLRCESA